MFLKSMKIIPGSLLACLAFVTINPVNAAISIDRTRVIIIGDEKSAQINVTNHSKKAPYLAQSWLENENGEKITAPLTVLPPLQRVEKDSTVQVNIMPLPSAAQLPQDRESLFFYNLQEIPPKSDKSNVIQLALRIKIKAFYRPAGLKKIAEENWQEKLQLSAGNNVLKLTNPTPFYIVIPRITIDNKPVTIEDDATTLKPGKEVIIQRVNAQNKSIKIQYINDYGAYTPLLYKCDKDQCAIIK
ncbi:fimbrial biogenesis chaperone [Serratia silvae]|uniref:Fimbria/pilus periplasmic chaperone n=1 Tax=Serratia silvae TaxID=2824122 RepID=A0ABT0KB13_9GAMM|nr:fimbria/pilus periplasmic chaperone [Serratia silvae]MCL1028987.1 fimbria/pilus periplasmic chaperone [Serratia silvae]